VDIGSVISTRRVPLEVERESSAPQFLPSPGACCSDVIFVGDVRAGRADLEAPLLPVKGHLQEVDLRGAASLLDHRLDPGERVAWKYVSTLLKS
jgi:hypothetical protein